VTLDHDLTALTLEADLLTKSVVTVLIGLRHRFWLWCRVRLVLLFLRLGSWVFWLRLRRSWMFWLRRRWMIWLRRSWMFGFGRSWVLWLRRSWVFGFGRSWVFGFGRSWVFGFGRSWVLWLRRSRVLWLRWSWVLWLWMRMIWLRRSWVIRLRRRWMLRLRFRWVGLVVTVLVVILIFLWSGWNFWLWLLFFIFVFFLLGDFGVSWGWLRLLVFVLVFFLLGNLRMMILAIVITARVLAILYRLGYVGNLDWRNADLAVVVLIPLLTALLILLSRLCVISTDDDRGRCGCKGQDGNDSGLSETHDEGRDKLLSD
jgi:hypothetical protein